MKLTNGHRVIIEEHVCKTAFAKERDAINQKLVDFAMRYYRSNLLSEEQEKLVKQLPDELFFRTNSVTMDFRSKDHSFAAPRTSIIFDKAIVVPMYKTAWEENYDGAFFDEGTRLAQEKYELLERYHHLLRDLRNLLRTITTVEKLKERASELAKIIPKEEAVKQLPATIAMTNMLETLNLAGSIPIDEATAAGD